MKTMTCTQLGGACDMAFRAETFDQIAEMSKQHGIAMYKKEDAAHRKAMEEMRKKMKNFSAMQAWFEGVKKEFNSLPEDK
jgi:hypothetical protein